MLLHFERVVLCSMLWNVLRYTLLGGNVVLRDCRNFVSDARNLHKFG